MATFKCALLYAFCASFVWIKIILTLSSQFVQLPDPPTNFHRPSTSRSTKLTESLKPSPSSPKGSESGTVTSIMYQGHLLILSTKLHPDSSTQVFSKISASNSPQCQKIWSGFEIIALKHEFLLNINLH